MTRLGLCLVIIILLVGCSQTGKAEPAENIVPVLATTEPNYIETASQTPTVARQPDSPTLIMPLATSSNPNMPPVATATQSVSLSVVPLVLSIATPEDESFASTSVISVTGRASVGAVVSVDGNLVELDPDGTFKTIVELVDGPNVIEIVASDLLGNERSEIIRVIYQP